jgi:SPP1 family predicted phage head-tail adaptor
MINAGKYRHRIAIHNAPLDSNRDTFGGRKGGLGTLVATVWAEKQDWSGSEVDEVGRETSTVITKWRIRYLADVKPVMQIAFDDETYDILNVLDFDGRKRELVIESRKVVE